MLNDSATILIADDEPRLRQSLAELLAGVGYTVSHAADGAEVLDAMRRGLPDAILLDLKMPRLDGISTLRALKEKSEWRRIPVVIITAFGGSEQTIEAMKSGACDYITKPFDPDEVLSTTARAVEVSRLSREVEELRTRAVTELARGRERDHRRASHDARGLQTDRQSRRDRHHGVDRR